jgi:hypothetical protein
MRGISLELGTKPVPPRLRLLLRGPVHSIGAAGA